MKMNYKNNENLLTVELEKKSDFKFKKSLKENGFKYDGVKKVWTITYTENIKNFCVTLKNYMNGTKVEEESKQEIQQTNNFTTLYANLSAIENLVKKCYDELNIMKAKTMVKTTNTNDSVQNITCKENAVNDAVLTEKLQCVNTQPKNVTLTITTNAVKEIDIPKNDESEQENITQNQIEEDEKLSSTDKKIIEESTTTQEDEVLKNYIDNQKWDSKKLKKFLNEKYPDIVFSVTKGGYGCDFAIKILSSKYDIDDEYLKNVEQFIIKLNNLSKYTYDNSDPYTDYFDSHDFIYRHNILDKYNYTKKENQKIENQKTFTQLKKDLKVGTKLKVIEHTIRPEQIGLVKTITRVFSNCIYTSCQQVKNGKEMYLPFPKHSTNVIYVDNRFTFNDTDKITYEIVKDDENTEHEHENKNENTTTNNTSTDEKIENVSDNTSQNAIIQENTNTTETTETTEITETTENVQDNTTTESINENKIVAVYYDIDEKTARTAQNINSFNDYKENSATESYKAKCDDFVEKVNTLIKNTDNPFMNLEKIQSIVNSYCKKYAEYLNNYYRVEAQCPSLMICGGGNFPVRKKEKQNQARENLYEKYKNLDDEYLTYAKNEITLTNIKSDDVQAVEKIQYLIDKAKAEQEKMKNVNAYYRKHKTLKDCELLTQQEKNKIESYMKTLSYNQPFETYNLTNNLQNIKRLEDRIKEIEKIKNMDNIEICLDGAKIYTDTESQRIKIDFECKPDTDTITLLKRHAYKWSKSNGVWQRQITHNALYDTKNLLLPKLIEAGYTKIVKSDMESVNDDASDTENNVIILNEDNTNNGNNGNNNTSEEATNTGYNTEITQADTNILLKNFDKLDKKLQNIVALTYQNKDKYVVFENGDFVELYLNNAISISKNLNLTLISIDNRFNLQSIKVDEDKHFYQTGITKLQYKNLLDNGTLKQDDIIYIPEECNDYQINYIYEAVQKTKQDIQNMFSENTKENTITADTSKKRQTKNNNKNFVKFCEYIIKNTDSTKPVLQQVIVQNDTQYCLNNNMLVMFKTYITEIESLQNGIEWDVNIKDRLIKPYKISNDYTELNDRDISIINNMKNLSYAKKVIKVLYDKNTKLQLKIANTMVDMDMLKMVDSIMDITTAHIISNTHYITFENNDVFVVVLGIIGKYDYAKKQDEPVYETPEVYTLLTTQTMSDKAQEIYNKFTETKSSTKSENYKYVKFCESLIDNKDNVREYLKQVLVQDNTQYCLDGYTLIKFKKYVPELESLQKDIECSIKVENIISNYKNNDKLVQLTDRDIKLVKNLNNLSYAKKILKVLNNNNHISLRIANTTIDADKLKNISTVIDIENSQVYSDGLSLYLEDDNVVIFVLGMRGTYDMKTRTTTPASETLEAYTLITEKTMSENAQRIYDELIEAQKVQQAIKQASKK